jgi:hypothetical protein
MPHGRTPFSDTASISFVRSRVGLKTGDISAGVCISEDSSGSCEHRREFPLNSADAGKLRVAEITRRGRFRRYCVPGDTTPCNSRAPVLNNPTSNPAAKIKAVVAIARQLAVDLWRVFTGQVEAEKFGLVYLPEAA